MIKLFEQFNNEQEIIDICKEYNIENYSINPDGSIDVDGNVNLTMFKLRELPLKFNKVNGWFSCSNNLLTSLEGCPKEVGGDFFCSRNNLTSLKGCPIVVGGGFNCSDNRITDLQGIPSGINGRLNCRNNNLTTLKGSPMIIYDSLTLQENPLSIIDSSIEVRGESIYVGSTNLDFSISLLSQEKLKILFEHGIDYNIFDKNGSISKYRLERMFKDFNI